MNKKYSVEESNNPIVIAPPLEYVTLSDRSTYGVRVKHVVAQRNSLSIRRGKGSWYELELYLALACSDGEVSCHKSKYIIIGSIGCISKSLLDELISKQEWINEFIRWDFCHFDSLRCKASKAVEQGHRTVSKNSSKSVVVLNNVEKSEKWKV